MDALLITRWIISMDQDEVVFERRLVPSDNPLNHLLEEDGDYQYTTFTIENTHFSIVYKEDEKEGIKSKIYVGKIAFKDKKQVILDLEHEDEKYIDILVDIFLKEDHTHLH